MITLRPHTLRYGGVTKGYQDPITGDSISGEPFWSEPVRCKYIPNGKGVEIELPNGDGKVHKYSYEVVLDVSPKDYKRGEDIRLFDQNATMITEKKVEGFLRGQLNMKIWV